jgi:hypothetical protein
MPQFPGRRPLLALYAPPPFGSDLVSGGSTTSVRALLDRLLHESQRRSYQFSEALGEVLEEFVETLRRAGESSEAVVRAVDSAVRIIQPNFRLQPDEAWKKNWDAYFNLYDALIQRAVITYFVKAAEPSTSG